MNLMNEEQIYLHVYNRGVSGQPIFATDANYVFLQSKMREFLPVYPITLIAYCLMPTHYHFLIQANLQSDISRFIQRLFNSYTQAFNRQQNRSGTLFESRAKSKIVDSDEYALQLCRYIHLNPVEAGLVTKPGLWKYSSFKEMGNTSAGNLTSGEFIQNFFSKPADYQEFVTSKVIDESRAN